MARPWLTMMFLRRDETRRVATKHDASHHGLFSMQNSRKNLRTNVILSVLSLTQWAKNENIFHLNFDSLIKNTSFKCESTIVLMEYLYFRSQPSVIYVNLAKLYSWCAILRWIMSILNLQRTQRPDTCASDNRTSDICAAL